MSFCSLTWTATAVWLSLDTSYCTSVSLSYFSFLTHFCNSPILTPLSSLPYVSSLPVFPFYLSPCHFLLVLPLFSALSPLLGFSHSPTVCVWESEREPQKSSVLAEQTIIRLSAACVRAWRKEGENERERDRTTGGVDQKGTDAPFQVNEGIFPCLSLSAPLSFYSTFSSSLPLLQWLGEASSTWSRSPPVTQVTQEVSQSENSCS